MFDAHSHVLPGMDDGAENEAMSIAMLRESARQGVTEMAVTPHFYAHREKPEAFLQRRDESCARLAAAAKGITGLPRLYPGAEVRFFEGIGGSDALDGLLLRNTNMILVEMPFTEWSRSMFDELRRVMNRQYIPIMAHINRYPAFSRPQQLSELMQMGMILQFNAEAFLSLFPRRRALRLLGGIGTFMLGSDCHNMDDRRPRMEEAMQRVFNVYGDRADELFYEPAFRK